MSYHKTRQKGGDYLHQQQSEPIAPTEKQKLTTGERDHPMWPRHFQSKPRQMCCRHTRVDVLCSSMPNKAAKKQGLGTIPSPQLSWRLRRTDPVLISSRQHQDDQPPTWPLRCRRPTKLTKAEGEERSSAKQKQPTCEQDYPKSASLHVPVGDTARKPHDLTYYGLRPRFFRVLVATFEVARLFVQHYPPPSNTRARRL